MIWWQTAYVSEGACISPQSPGLLAISYCTNWWDLASVNDQTGLNKKFFRKMYSLSCTVVHFNLFLPFTLEILIKNYNLSLFHLSIYPALLRINSMLPNSLEYPLLVSASWYILYYSSSWNKGWIRWNIHQNPQKRTSFFSSKSRKGPPGALWNTRDLLFKYSSDWTKRWSCVLATTEASHNVNHDCFSWIV